MFFYIIFHVKSRLCVGPQIIIHKFYTRKELTLVSTRVKGYCYMPAEGTDITNIIKGKGNDELHKYIRKGYPIKTRPSRRKY